MSQDTDSFEISALLREWYHKNKRDLPWRKTKNPYKIWISEIILQQTRVAQGMDYFLRFMTRFPDIRSLAIAEEDEVLKYWEGLGYYSRARNLHAAAKMVVDQYKGVFPQEHKEVLALKGIGDYTAAAIVSFVWNQPYPVVDGNVFRVLARLFGVETPIDTGKGKREFTQLAGLILDPEHAGEHNQAIMEFGALQCVPQNPDCEICPLRGKCVANATHTVSVLPVKQNKIRTRNRYFHYFNITMEGDTWLNRRSGKDIWQGLYEFPLIETEQPMDFLELQQTEAFQELFEDAEEVSVTVDLYGLKHVLSHQVIYTTFYKVNLKKKISSLDNYLQISGKEIDKYAVSRLVQIYLEKSAGTTGMNTLF